MKKLGQIGFVLLFLLSACAAPQTSPVPETATRLQGASSTLSRTTATSTESPTLSATPLPTASETPSASAMPTLTDFPTESETPEPTLTGIPYPLTPLPTFDQRKAHKIPTQPPVICPTTNSNIVLAETTQLSEDDFSKYINAGGDLNVFKSTDFGQREAKIVDLTGDGIPEIIFAFSTPDMTIYGCKDGKFESLELSPEISTITAYLENISDLNKNGIPELLVHQKDNVATTLRIYEWDGSGFRSLIQDRYNPFDSSQVYDWVRGAYQIRDTNGDDLQEISVVDDQFNIAFAGAFTPFVQIVTLAWDGAHYINMAPGNYLPPIYRYQAVQLADREVLYKNYKKALAFYESAMFDTHLEAWTRERMMYRLITTGITPAPDETTPAPDPDEYDRVVAYATYRSMILHVYLGQVDIALKEYKRLLAYFLPDSPGFPYAALANQFWKTYRSSEKIADACQAAIQYATGHDEVLEPLWYHDTRGLEDHKYTPYDICPFAENKK